MRLALLALGIVFAGCASSAEPASRAPLEQEILALAASMERMHRELFHAVPRSEFRAQAESLAARAPQLSRDQLVTGLMRLAALPGERDGHTGIFPFDRHAKTLHFYPLRLYDFADGLHVVGALTADDLTGRRLTAIAGRPIEQVMALVRPLVPHDNESSRRWRLPEYVVTAEVLRGLGIVDGPTAVFSFADGTEATLYPVSAGHVAGTLGGAPAPLPTQHDPVWLRHLEDEQWLTTLQRGRALYLGYRLTTGPTYDLAQRLLRLARRPGVRRVVVDTRLNHGGDNTTYGPLFDVLRRPVIERKLVVLTGRATFSAAGNFVADVERFTKARFVGEPSGGAPSQWGDRTPVELRLAGLRVNVANSYWEFGPRGDRRLAIEPDVLVEPTAADFFAGRDPVLTRAL